MQATVAKETKDKKGNLGEKRDGNRGVGLFTKGRNMKISITLQGLCSWFSTRDLAPKLIHFGFGFMKVNNYI